MAVARNHLMKKCAWDASEIEDTSAYKSYDFECVRGRRTVRVEVKGLSGRFGAVTLTRREVEHARTATCRVVLIVVHDIDVVTAQQGYRGTGGHAVVWDPWDVDAGAMTPAAFDYFPPPLLAGSAVPHAGPGVNPSTRPPEVEGGEVTTPQGKFVWEAEDLDWSDPPRARK